MRSNVLTRWLIVSACGAVPAVGQQPVALEQPVTQEQPVSAYPDMPIGSPPVAANEAACAGQPGSMQVYTETIPGTKVGFAMVPIPGGRFPMGSADEEADREDCEGPLHEVAVDPFWLGRTEVTWDEYLVFMSRLDQGQRQVGAAQVEPQDPWADAVSRPTPPYVPMNFGMGVEHCPAVCMTQFAAKQYTKWLSMKTGRHYRLPTEAEWEYACRAGTTTAYSFGDDPAELEAYAWYFDDAGDRYHPVAEKKRNPWGLFDMHGNVAEWVIDQFHADFYARCAAAPGANPVDWPTEVYPRVVRGGSWDDDADRLRSAARSRSKEGWMIQDPQIPKSIWYHTDARHVGFRVARSLRPLTAEEQARFWEADVDSIRRIQETQRAGGR